MRPLPPRHRHRRAVRHAGPGVGRRDGRLHRLELRRRRRPGLDRDHRPQREPADLVRPHAAALPGRDPRRQRGHGGARSSATRATPATRPARTSTGRSCSTATSSTRACSCRPAGRPVADRGVHAPATRRFTLRAVLARASIGRREADDGGDPRRRRGRAPVDPVPGARQAGRAVRRQVPDHRLHAVELRQLGHRRRRRPDPVQPALAQRPHRAGPAVGPRPQHAAASSCSSRTSRAGASPSGIAAPPTRSSGTSTSSSTTRPTRSWSSPATTSTRWTTSRSWPPIAATGPT